MMQHMNTLSRIGLSAAAIILLFASVAFASHTWSTYHWARTSNPFTLKLGDNLSTNWKSYLATTSSAWSQSTVLDTTIVPGLGGSNCRAQTGRVEVCNRKYGFNGWIGLAQIWISGSHITKGLAKMNDTYFNLSQYNNPNEKLHVMCQEVGHTLGLGHTSEDGSSQGTCMDYSNSPSSTLPNAHDYAQLEGIYAHLDSSTTLSQMSASKGQADIVSDDPRTWGRETHRSADGRASLYERDFGNGEKVFTHVFWAEEEARSLSSRLRESR